MSLDHLRALEAHSLHVIETALAEVRKPCITCSFQAEGMVVLHILRARRADVPVLFLDTVHHFAETYAYRDRIAKAWRLNLITLRAAEPAPGLWQVSTDACCRRHKVEPLFATLEAYDAWFTGLRREQSPSRATLEENADFTLPSGKTIRKINPLARWSTADVQEYARMHPRTTFVDGSGAAPDPNPASNFFKFNTDGAQWMAGLGSYAYHTLGWRRAVTVSGAQQIDNRVAREVSSFDEHRAGAHGE